MADPTKPQEEGSPSERRLEFHFLKAPDFRVVYAEGVYGGITPRGLIQMNFFTERPPLPRAIFHEITPELTLGDEVMSEREMRTGVIRDFHMGASMTLDTARAFRAWLDEKIKTLETVAAQPEETR